MSELQGVYITIQSQLKTFILKIRHHVYSVCLLEYSSVTGSITKSFGMG